MKHKSPLALYLQRFDLTRKDLVQRKQEVTDNIDTLDKLYKKTVATDVSQKHLQTSSGNVNSQGDSDNSYNNSESKSSTGSVPTSNLKHQKHMMGDFSRAYNQQRQLLTDTVSFLDSKVSELLKMKRKFQNEYPIMIRELVKRNLPTKGDLEDSVQEEFRRKKDIAVNRMKICLNDFHAAVNDRLNKDNVPELKNLLNKLQAKNSTSTRSRPQKKTKITLSPHGKAKNPAGNRPTRSGSVSKERMLSKAKQLRASQQTCPQAGKSSILTPLSTWGSQPSAKEQDVLKTDGKAFSTATSGKDGRQELAEPGGKGSNEDIQVPEISSSVQDRGHAEGASFGETLNESSLMTLSTVSATLGDSSVQTSDNSEVPLNGMSGRGYHTSDLQTSGPSYTAVLSRPPSSMRGRSKYIQIGLPEQRQDSRRLSEPVVPSTDLYPHFPRGNRQGSQGYYTRQPNFPASLPRRSQSHQTLHRHHPQPAEQRGYYQPYYQPCFHARRAQSAPRGLDSQHVVTIGRYCPPVDYRRVAPFAGASSDYSSMGSAASSSSQCGSVDETDGLKGLNQDSQQTSEIPDNKFVTVKLVKTEDVKRHRGPGLVSRTDKKDGFLFPKDKSLQEVSDYILKRLKIYRRGGMRLWLFEDVEGLFLPRRMLKGRFMYNSLGSLNRETVTLFVQVAEEKERLFSFDHTNMRFVFVKTPSADTGNFVVKGHHNIDISKATKAVIQVLKRKFMPNCPSPLRLFIEMGNNKMLVVPQTSDNITLKDNTCGETRHGDVLLLLEDFIGQDSELLDVSTTTSYNQSTTGEPLVMPLSPYPAVPSPRLNVPQNSSTHLINPISADTKSKFQTEQVLLETADETVSSRNDVNEDGVARNMVTDQRVKQCDMSTKAVQHAQQFIIPYDYPTSSSSTDESLPSPDSSDAASLKRHHFPLWDLTSHYMARFHDNREQLPMTAQCRVEENGLTDGQRGTDETSFMDRTSDSVMVFSKSDFLDSVGYDSTSVSVTFEGSHFEETSLHVSNFNETSGSNFHETSFMHGSNYENSSHAEHTDSECRQNATVPNPKDSQHLKEKGLAKDRAGLFELEVQPPTSAVLDEKQSKPGLAAHKLGAERTNEMSANEKELKRVASMLVPRTVLRRKEVVRGRQLVNGELDMTPLTPNNSTGSVTSAAEPEEGGKSGTSQGVSPLTVKTADSKQSEKDATPAPFTPVTPQSVAGSSDVFLSDDGGGEDDPSVYYTPRPAFVFPETDPRLQSTKLPAMDNSDDYGAQFHHSQLNAEQISAITNCSSSFMAIRGQARSTGSRQPESEQISAIPNISSSFMEIPVQHQLHNQSLAEHTTSFSGIIAQHNDQGCQRNPAETRQRPTDALFELSSRQPRAPAPQNGGGHQLSVKMENPSSDKERRSCGNQPQSQSRTAKQFPDTSQSQPQFPTKSDAVLVKEADPAIMQIGTRVFNIAKKSSLNANANVFIPRGPMSTRLDTVHEQDNEGTAAVTSTVSGQSEGGDPGQRGQVGCSGPAQHANQEAAAMTATHQLHLPQQPPASATQPSGGCHAAAQRSIRHQKKATTVPRSQREMPATTSALVASKLLPCPALGPDHVGGAATFPFYPMYNLQRAPKPAGPESPGSISIQTCIHKTDGTLLPPRQRHPEGSRHVTFADQPHGGGLHAPSNLHTVPFSNNGRLVKDDSKAHHLNSMQTPAVVPRSRSDSTSSARATGQQLQSVPVPRKRIGSGRFEERPRRQSIDLPKQSQPQYQPAPQGDAPQSNRNSLREHKAPLPYHGAKNFHTGSMENAQSSDSHYSEGYQGYNRGARFQQQDQGRFGYGGSRGSQAVSADHYHSDPQEWGFRNTIPNSGYANRRNSGVGSSISWGYSKPSSCHHSNGKYSEMYRQPRSSLGQYKHNSAPYKNHFEDFGDFANNRYKHDHRMKKCYARQQHGATSSSDQSDNSFLGTESRYLYPLRFRRMSRPIKESEAESSAGSVTFRSEASNSENVPELPVSAVPNTCSSNVSGSSSESKPVQANNASQHPPRSRRGYIQIGLGDSLKPHLFRANSDPNA